MTDQQLLVRFFIVSSCEAAVSLQSTQAHEIKNTSRFGGRGGEELSIREGGDRGMGSQRMLKWVRNRNQRSPVSRSHGPNTDSASFEPRPQFSPFRLAQVRTLLHLYYRYDNFV